MPFAGSHYLRHLREQRQQDLTAHRARIDAELDEALAVYYPPLEGIRD